MSPKASPSSPVQRPSPSPAGTSPSPWARVLSPQGLSPSSSPQGVSPSPSLSPDLHGLDARLGAYFNLSNVKRSLPWLETY